MECIASIDPIPQPSKLLTSQILFFQNNKVKRGNNHQQSSAVANFSTPIDIGKDKRKCFTVKNKRHKMLLVLFVYHIYIAPRLTAHDSEQCTMKPKHLKNTKLKTPAKVTNDRVADRVIMIGNIAISLICHFSEIPKPDDTTMF